MGRDFNDVVAEIGGPGPDESPEEFFERLGVEPNVSLAVADHASIEDSDARPPEFSDEALALRFSDRWADDLRYVAAWGRWFGWAGHRWQQDDTLAVFDRARAICRESAAEAAASRHHAATARTVAAAKTVAAVEKLARSDRRHAATTDQWDRDPFLLNTPDGVVDLRTGALRPTRREDYCTKTTAVAPAENSYCPLWLEFLDRIFARDRELVAFLRRVCGYSLTGVTNAHALFFGHGTGANGKSVFVNTVRQIFGDYATSAPVETFMASHNDRHPTELADLRGARLVSSVETEEGRRWAESRIKHLTGDDPIKARFMRQDLFEFLPTFKLLFMGNHKPSLRGVDEAIRRRFHLIPFAVTIPPEERDRGLTDSLRSEWPSIMAWMIRGCLEWQRQGLSPPAAVIDATASYLEAEDALAQWLEDACLPDGQAFEASSALYASWKAWADRSGEYAGSQKRFVQAMEARGYTWTRKRDGRGFVGLRLVRHDYTDDLRYGH